MKIIFARISVIASALFVAAGLAIHPIFFLPALVWGLLFMTINNGSLDDAK